jgi:hypothetical protein
LGAFLIAALLDVLRQAGSRVGWNMPTAFYVLTSAVLMDMLALARLWAGPTDLLYSRSNYGSPIFLGAGFVFIITNVILVRKRSGPGTGIIWAGSKALLIIAVFGFIGIILALPGMPLH